MGRPRQPIKTQGATPSLNKAWLLGILAGDGSVKETTISVWVGPDEGLAYECVKVIEDVYGVPSTVEIYGPGHKRPDKYQNEVNYNVVCGRRNVVDDIASIAPFGIHTWRVPQVVKQGTSLIKGAWLSGYFDADGKCSFSRTPKATNRTISVSSVNRIGIKQAADILLSLGINTKMYKHTYKEPSKASWKPRYDLHVMGRENQEAFGRVVGFRSQSKRETLDLCLHSFKNTYAIKRGEGVEVLPRILELREQGYSLESIAEILELRSARHAQEIIQRAVNRGETKTHDRGKRQRELLPIVRLLRDQGFSWLDVGRVLGHEGTDQQATSFALGVRRWAVRHVLW